MSPSGGLPELRGQEGIPIPLAFVASRTVVDHAQHVCLALWSGPWFRSFSYWKVGSPTPHAVDGLGLPLAKQGATV